MDNLFDVLKMVSFNHLNFASQQVVITDIEGKPNGLLTDLYRDVVNKVNLFIDIEDADSPESVRKLLREYTPLPDDVLEEYQKILEEKLIGINFAPQKGQMELLVRG